MGVRAGGLILDLFQYPPFSYNDMMGRGSGFGWGVDEIYFFCASPVFCSLKLGNASAKTNIHRER